MLIVTQTATEVLAKPASPTARVTQIATETLRSPTTAKARPTQFTVEILRQNASSANVTAQQQLIIIVAA